MLQAPQEVLPTGGNGFMDDLRVGDREVGGTDGIQPEAEQEVQPVAFFLIQALDARDRPQPGRGKEQVGLFERIKGRILLPVWSAEALITGLWLDDRFAFLAQSPQGERAVRHHLGRLLYKVVGEFPQPKRMPEGIEPEQPG